MSNQEQLNSIALTQLSCVSLVALHELYQCFGSATEIIANRKNLREKVPDISPKLEQTLQNIDEALHKAEGEMEWCEANNIEIISLNNPSYPQRLARCVDAPIVLYYKGNGNLNHKKIVAIVGTRHCTTYGRDVLRHFMQDMKSYADILVVSGLAYGVDIMAHREAMKNGFPTIAVLAHGLDMIYPATHRNTAIDMLNEGGLVTEYTSQTFIGKRNFVQRNRIVAGLADCVIVVESAAKGGGLITASIARSYHRDIFAIPGAIRAEYSKGCNNLIRDNEAALISSAEDLVKAMRWNDDEKLLIAHSKGITQDLFNNLSEEEKILVEILQKTNDLQVNILTVKSGIPINKVLTLMFSLELRGIVKTMAGGVYHLL